MASAYWARFEQRGASLLRFDTRIYLGAVERPRRTDRPLGCIIGKNPGSAVPIAPSGDLQAIALDGDHFLPCVRSIVAKARDRAGVALPPGAFVQVLNLFYLCQRDLRRAKEALRREPVPEFCRSERRRFPWRWYAWGGPDPALDPLKQRFQGRPSTPAFFLNTADQRLDPRVPGVQDRARHTQGMVQDAVVAHLAKLLPGAAGTAHA